MKTMNQMKFFKAALAAIAMFASGTALAESCNGLPDTYCPKPGTEMFQYKDTAAGPSIILRQTGVTNEETARVTVEFALGDFDFANNNHIAVGVGDIYRALAGKSGAKGEGFVIGLWNGCADKGLITARESFSSNDGKIIDSNSCISVQPGLAVYKIIATINPFHTGTLELWRNGVLVERKSSTWAGEHNSLYNRGFFFIPVQNVPTGKFGLRSVTIEALKD